MVAEMVSGGAPHPDLLPVHLDAGSDRAASLNERQAIAFVDPAWRHSRSRRSRCETFEAGKVPDLPDQPEGRRPRTEPGTSADTVIHYDPWWNPAAEDQASDRAHRIGQTKSVFVYKLIAADTVEERIVELQQRKADLASIALSEAGGTATGFDADDIDFLFAAEQERQAA